VQSALDELWRFTNELFAPDALDDAMAAQGVGAAAPELRSRWLAHIEAVLREATLKRPMDVTIPGTASAATFGASRLRAGGNAVLQRTYPDSRW